jgi:hypothetical protein
LTTSHFLTIMLRPSSWSRYSSRLRGNSLHDAAGLVRPAGRVEDEGGTEGTRTWLGMTC